MKKLTLLLLFTIPLFCEAQTDIKQLTGKWEESFRTTKKNKKIDFTDTLRMEIRPDGFMMLRHTKGATITGQGEIRNGSLYLENTESEIVEFTNNRLVLHDNSGNHHFDRMNEFTNSPVTKVIPGVETGRKDISMSTIKGKWSCYKKTDPDFSTGKFYIKSIEFKEDKGNGLYTGTAAFNNSDSVYTRDVSIIITGKEIMINAGQETLKAEVLKSDGDEMILQSGSIHYFLKQFGKKD